MESHLAAPHDAVEQPTRLKIFRISAGLDQRQLAERAGISRDTVSHLERRKFGPSRRTAKALAAALGVTEEALWGQDG